MLVTGCSATRACAFLGMGAIFRFSFASFPGYFLSPSGAATAVIWHSPTRSSAMMLRQNAVIENRVDDWFIVIVFFVSGFI